MEGNKHFLEVQNVKKYFKTPRGMLHAVDDISFGLDKGKTLGLVGESGCGKSTLGRVVLRLLEPTDGHVTFNGEDVFQLNKTQLRRKRCEMQLIFQDPFSSLDPRQTVAQAIKEPIIVHNQLKDKKEIDEKIRELMDTVGLSERYVNTYPHELDGGRRQRIGIARALALDPQFIVCDEPVSALDVSIQAQILNLLKNLQHERNLTYLFITHDLSVVNYFSDDIAVMYLGKIVEKAPVEALFERRLHPYTQALLSAIPIPNLEHKEKRVVLPGEITSPINPKPGCRFFNRCLYATEECKKCEPKLTEVEPEHFVACFRAGSEKTEIVEKGKNN